MKKKGSKTDPRKTPIDNNSKKKNPQETRSFQLMENVRPKS